MVCLWGTLVEPFVRAALRQRAQRDRIYLRTACFTAKQVYERAGLLYTDLESVVSVRFSHGCRLWPLVADRTLA